MNNSGYQMCSKCVLDTSVREISFDENQVCNYCHQFEKYAQKTIFRNKAEIDMELQDMVAKIKEKGKDHEYDCILGVSGGVDSTYLAYLSKQLGLRPLVVHFDNGWNSELAVKNIENIVGKLGFDLVTYVMDWEEFKDIQRAYIRASVVDIEIPTDQFIFAALNKIAYKKKIGVILSGWNVATEGVMPSSWIYGEKFDLVNLKDIHKKFGVLKSLDKLPKFGKYQYHFYWNIAGIRLVPLLNNVPYVKAEIKEKIKKELDWKDYGGKHYESIFTRFYQGYILPKKFNIDKRRAHLSTLILSGQITKEEALKELESPTYPLDLQESDKEYVAKKLEISPKEFDDIMSRPRVEHKFYKTHNDYLYNKLFYLYRILIYLPIRFLRLIGLLPTPIKLRQY